MVQKTLKLAILSDLHCHPSRTESEKNATYLLTDILREPSENHPTQGLIEQIEQMSITSDIVLCPGDFTDRCDPSGLLFGWSNTLEIGRALKANNVYATLGNHDVDSRNIKSTDSFSNVKGVKQGFPLSDKKNREELLGKGFTFIEEELYQLLIINSVHYHHNSSESVKGKVDSTQISEIDQYLKVNSNDKIKILLVHHHPVQHERLGLGGHDIIENGVELLDVLGYHKFDLVIHGHKHDPWLRNQLTKSEKNITIFSSGSFSSTSNIIFNSKRNTFHLLEISKNNGRTNGKIETLTYIPKVGWMKNNPDSHGFPPLTGFGYTEKIEDLCEKVKDLVGNRSIVYWNEVINEVPDINHLTPNQTEELESMLYKAELIISNKISLTPEIISNPNGK